MSHTKAVSPQNPASLHCRGPSIPLTGIAIRPLSIVSRIRAIRDTLRKPRRYFRLKTPLPVSRAIRGTAAGRKCLLFPERRDMGHRDTGRRAPSNAIWYLINIREACFGRDGGACAGAIQPDKIFGLGASSHPAIVIGTNVKGDQSWSPTMNSP
jgi:hypothetical protein